MLKTPLKIAALSVASLTLLSACVTIPASLLDSIAQGSRTISGADGTSISYNIEDNNVAGDGDSAIHFNTGARSNTGTVSQQPSVKVTVTEAVPVVLNPIVAIKQTGPYSSSGTPNDSSDDTYDITSAGSRDTFDLGAGTDDALIMTVNGVDYTITPGEFVYTGDGSVELYTPVSGFNLAQVLDGTHSSVHGTFVNYNTNNPDLSSGTANFDFTKGYTAIGIPTLASFIDTQTVMVTYTGYMQLELDNFRQTPDTPIKETEYGGGSGQLEMTVDFTTNAVSGTAELTFYGDAVFVNDVVTEQPELIGTMIATFGSASINGNGFTGAFSLDDKRRDFFGITNNPSGVYAGNFFGPNAENLAGVISINGETVNGVKIGIGGFDGSKSTIAGGGNGGGVPVFSPADFVADRVVSYHTGVRLPTMGLPIILPMILIIQ